MADRLTKEAWEELEVEEQERIKAEEPDIVPDDALSEAELGERKEKEKKTPPMENVIGERVRKEVAKVTKELKEQYEEELRKLREKPPTSAQGSDYWQKEAARLEALGIIKTPEELQADAQITANTVLQMRQMEKARKREIREQIRKIAPEDRKLYEDDIREELEDFSENMPLPADAAERALIFAKGKNVNNLVENARKDMEKQFKKRRIEGEDTGEGTYIPEGGGSFITSNKVATARQKRLAEERGISNERQIWLDEKAAKREEKRNKEKK